MPRGNDSAAALVDLRGEYGQFGGNAEDMIEAGRLDPDLRTANLVPTDHDATEALLSDDGVDKADKKVGDAKALDLAVHGDWVVVIYETESGRTFKQAFPYEDFGGPKSRSGVKPREESEDEKHEREAREARFKDAAEAAAARSDAEQKAQAAEAKAKASSAKKD